MKFLIAALVLPGALAPLIVQAQAYPAKRIRLIVPVAAGSATDILARIVAQKMTEQWGQQVVVDNRVGAGSVVGAMLGAQALADGYTLTMMTSSMAINPALRANIPYDLIRDFAPIANLAMTPQTIAAFPGAEFKTLKEFVAAGGTFRQFQVMSNELGTPKILLCPDDSARSWATNFTTLKEVNVSYFVVPEADVGDASMWLVGDRNLTVSGKPLLSGLHWLPTNSPMGWTAQMHENKGNISFANASVQQLSNAKLRESAAAALLAFQKSNATNAPFRLLIP